MLIWFSISLYFTPNLDTYNDKLSSKDFSKVDFFASKSDDNSHTFSWIRLYSLNNLLLSLSPTLRILDILFSTSATFSRIFNSNALCSSTLDLYTSSNNSVYERLSSFNNSEYSFSFMDSSDNFSSKPEDN